MDGSDIASTTQRNKLASEVADLKNKEIKAGELKKEIADGQQKGNALVGN